VKLQYSGQERIAATKAAVWAFVTDPEKVGNCLPEVQSVTVQDATHFDAVVQAGVGPVRGKFKFKVELQPDRDADRMTMKIAGGGFGSAVDLTAGARISADGDTSSVLDWSGEAVMRGPVATVGGRVLDAQARKLIEQAFKNVAAKLSAGG
jgi:carbon monoxide dehydrogenase subunit G